MSEAAGWFGKLASLGDFAQRRVSADWVGIVDDWLSASMLAGQELLREHWTAAYLQAPVLRFAWAPGVIDEQWWFGVLMPSCDSVGRYFPLVIAQPRRQPPQDRIALDHLELWLDHLANAAIQTLSDAGVSIEDFEAMLLDAPPWPTAGTGSPLMERSTLPDGAPSNEHWTCALAVHPPLFRCLQALAGVRMEQQMIGHSLWWRIDPQAAGQDSLDILKGLPDGGQFVALVQVP